MRRRLISGAIAASLVGGTIVTGWQLEKSHRMEDDLAQSRLREANAETEKARAVATAAEADAATAAAKTTVLKAAYEVAQSVLSAEQALLERDKEAAARQRETDRANTFRQSNVLMRADMAARSDRRRSRGLVFCMFRHTAERRREGRSWPGARCRDIWRCWRPPLEGIDDAQSRRAAGRMDRSWSGDEALSHLTRRSGAGTANCCLRRD
jgi:hypothetical protein